MRRVRAKLTYANVTSSIALFMVLGGSAYAATTLPKNSVGSKQIRANAVRSSKVKNHSLLRKDFKAGQLPAGPEEPTGQTGLTGPAGPKGDTGSPGVSGGEIVTGPLVDNPAGSQDSSTVSCPTGKLAVGGGAFGENGITQSINTSIPTGNGWRVDMNNTGAVGSSFTVYVLCAIVAP